MPIRAAVVSGNWSSTSTWNNGVLPGSGDTVASNGFTVTIDQNVNVDSLTNAAMSATSMIPIMSGFTSPSGIVTSSGDFSGYPAWLIFDNSGGTHWVSSTSTGWVAYEFTTAKIITRYVMSGVWGGQPTSFPKNWTFEGWDGASWIVLHTVTGNTSTSAYTGTFTNTTAYIKYRINITLNNGYPYMGFAELFVSGTNDYLVNTTAGGTFNLNSGVTVTCTNTGDGISQVANTACVVVNTTDSPIINANIRGRDGSTVRCVRKTGTGNLTINGTLRGQYSSSGNGGALEIANSGTVTINGNVFEGPANGSTIYVGSTCTLNIVGDITSGTWNNNFTVDVAANNCQLNVTGNIIVGFQSTAGWSATVFRISGSGNTLNIVGNIDSTLGTFQATISKFGLYITGVNCVVTHTGHIIGSSDNVSGTSPVYITNTVYYNHVGYIKASINFHGLYSLSTASIHLLTGPFICSPVGIQPFYVTRMHYRRTMGSYFEFRDNSTNGALPPAGSAPATRLVSPDTVVDAPSPANVRFGTVYALGSQTGTMKVPAAANVRLGVEVDNTTGTAVLAPGDVWDYLRTNMNTSGSIGERLKNASTVDSTGTQIASITI